MKREFVLHKHVLIAIGIAVGVTIILFGSIFLLDSDVTTKTRVMIIGYYLLWLFALWFIAVLLPAILIKLDNPYICFSIPKTRMRIVVEKMVLYVGLSLVLSGVILIFYYLFGNAFMSISFVDNWRVGSEYKDVLTIPFFFGLTILISKMNFSIQLGNQVFKSKLYTGIYAFSVFIILMIAFFFRMIQVNAYINDFWRFNYLNFSIVLFFITSLFMDYYVIKRGDY